MKKLALALSLLVVSAVALVASGAASAADTKPTTVSSWATCLTTHGVTIGDPSGAAKAMPGALEACGIPGKANVGPVISCLRSHAFDIAVGSVTAGAGVDEGGRLIAVLKQCSADARKLDARLARFKVCLAKNGVTVPSSASGFMSLGWKLLIDRDGIVSAVKACRTSAGSLTLPPALQKALGS